MGKLVAYLLIAVLISGCVTSQSGSQLTNSDFEKEILDYQEEQNAYFADSTTSPLLSEDVATFLSLDFFPPNPDFRVIATLELTPDAEAFQMKTSTSRMPMYRQYGILHFSVKGKKCKLSVFQNLKLINQPLYANHLFLPFRDKTSGKTTYGGGRYLDLEIPEGNEITLDFNKAYNPYCAYNYKYSCPVPPEENTLNIEVTAGVKSFDGH